jgi:hypothetical protein
MLKLEGFLQDRGFLRSCFCVESAFRLALRPARNGFLGRRLLIFR